MGFDLRNKKKWIMLAACLFAAAMVLYPQVTATGSKSAMSIWLNAIVPVLLPFFIFADFLKRTGYLEKLPPRLYPLLVAFLSGYPIGAKATCDLVCEGTLDRAEGRRVLSYSLVTGPAFLSGTIGAFLGSGTAALIVAVAHYGGALLNGLVFGGARPWAGGRKRKPVRAVQQRTDERSGLPNGFTLSVMAGFKAMAMILAFLMLFMIGIDLLEFWGLFHFLGSESASAVLKGLLEMTVGTSMLGACNISLAFKTVLTAILVSFGGLSVIGQATAMTGDCGIGAFDILRIKAGHGLLSGILAVFLVYFVL